MGRSSLPLKLAFSISLALTLTASSPQSLPPFPKIPSFLSLKSSSCPTPPSPSPRTTASHLLALLGSPQDAARVPAAKARELRSCLLFLVPFAPASLEENGDLCRRHDADNMVWWPPEPVMELAQLAIASGGDPAVIQMALDPTPLPVPDVEGLRKDKCQLTTTPYGYRFANKELNTYFAFMFELIAERGPLVGLDVCLSRYDLFHGHLFIATDSGRLGMLFHAKEYPAYEKESFPYNMGYCQKGSNVVYDDSMNLRNILWLAPLPDIAEARVAPGVLVVLDAHPEGILYKELVPEYVDIVRTIYEDDFGEHVADVNYLKVVNVTASERIFMC